MLELSGIVIECRPERSGKRLAFFGWVGRPSGGFRREFVVCLAEIDVDHFGG